MTTEQVIKFPIPGRQHEQIDYVCVFIYPSSRGDGLIEFRIDVQTNESDYHKVETIPTNIMESHFDQIFSRAKEELKRFIIAGN